MAHRKVMEESTLVIHMLETVQWQSLGIHERRVLVQHLH